MKILGFAITRIIIVWLVLTCPCVVQCAVIFDSFTPDNLSCTEPNGFGCLCESRHDCNMTQHMECIDYKCFCEYPMHRTYDNKLKKCVSLVGSVCDSVFADELPRCIRNAECEDGRCICREGYTVTTKLTCMVGHGQECGPMQCNTDRGLACKSGICECLDKSYTYSAITRSCFDPEGFVKNVVETWFGRTFLRDMILRSAAKFFRKVISVLKSPKRLLRVFIG